MKQLATQGTTVLKPAAVFPDSWTPANTPDGFIDPAEGRFVLLINKDEESIRAIMQLPDFDGAWRVLETVTPQSRAHAEMLYHHEGAWVLIWPANPPAAAPRPGVIVPGSKVRLLPQFVLRHERGQDSREVFTVADVATRPDQGPVVALVGVEGWVEACCFTTDLGGGGQ